MREQSRRRLLCLAAVALLVANTGGCIRRGQRYNSFITRTPLTQQDVLVLGFLGGREAWNNDERGVRQLALKLRTASPPTVHFETLENKKRSLAIELITRAFDRDGNGRLDREEAASVKLILYGQSFGGAAVVKLARQLKKTGVPVFLTLQVDSVGRDDAVIPSNVISAANLFQRNGWFIRGEPEIRAEDPSRTTIIGNFRFDYRNKKIDISKVPWTKKAFRIAHTRMEHDPDVWAKAEALLTQALEKLR